MAEPKWRRYLRFLRPDAARDVDDELAFHLAMREQEFVAAGLSPEEARRMTRDRFGDVREARKATLAVDTRRSRAERRVQLFDSLIQDLRYGVRTLWQQRAFSAAVVATLALGIGATTAMFSAVDAALLRPLPFTQPDQLVVLHGVPVPFAPNGVTVEAEAIGPDLTSVRGMADLFASVDAFAMGAMNLSGDGAPARVNVGVVTSGLFRTVGVPPLIGRTFTDDEGRIGGALVAVLSEGLWRRRFGAAPALGKTLVLNGRRFEIVGVMPRGFVFPERSDVWIPLTVPMTISSFDGFRGWIGSDMVARLAPGVTREAAWLRMRAEFDRMPPEYRRGRDEQIRKPVVPLHETLAGAREKPLLLLLGTTALLLLIACVNVTNLLLGRAATRRREIALRAVLGATRGRIVRQLLVESLILSMAGAGAGLAVAFAGMGTVRALMPDAMSLVAPPAVDLRVLAFAASLSLVSGLAFGLWPAFGAARADANETIKSGGLGTTTAGAGRLRRVLVVVELAVALTLVTGSLLMLRSFKALLDTDPGFRPGQVATVELAFERGQGAGLRLAVLADVVARLEGSPGIEAAGVVNDLPLRGSGGIAVSVDAEGVSTGASRNNFARFLQASGGYFQALGIPLVRGRVMRPTDDSAAPKVVVVNETMARTIWPGQDAIGKRFKDFGPPGDGPQAYRTVIGIVADVREHALDADPGLQMYLPVYEQTPSNAAIVVRGTLARAALLSRLREAVHAARPDQALFNLRTMDEVLSTARAPRRTNTTLLTAFGALALLLAAIGVFGVVSYGVTRRTRELGIRAALGASAGSLVRLVATEGLLLALAGISLGLGGAWVFSRALASLLYGVAPQDVTAFIAAPLVLFGFVVVATLIPARRAAALNPVDVIRQD